MIRTISTHSRRWLAVVVLLAVFSAVAFDPAGASGTVTIAANTSTLENQPGWMFGRDPSNATPYAFDSDEASIGDGSLHVLPIGATPAKKFIGEFFMVSPLADVDTISYDFQIGAGGDAGDADQFYMNVYANFGVSSPTKYYDCRYDIVPASGSTGSFTTVTFDPTLPYPVATRVSSPTQPCPPTPADMGAGAILRAFALNVGDTSGSDVDLDGYLDNVVVTLTGDTTTYDFEPSCTAVCYVDDAGSDANGGTSPADAKKTIQAAINTVDSGGQVRVLPGAYNETAPNSAPTSLGGVYQFGLFFHSSKPGITVMGVTGGDAAITDASLTEAAVTTNATNNFGYSGIFVEAANTAIQGLTIGDNFVNNLVDNNKTIEVIADNFTLRYSRTAVTDGGSIYISDFAPLASVVESYSIVDNLFDDATQVAISSGAGEEGPVASRLITGNTFAMNGATYPGVSFNGAGAVPWFTQPVGGAVITGNSFSGSTQYIRARGTYTEAEFDWESFWDENTYDKAVVALETEVPFDVRAFSYVSGAYNFTNVRRIGAVIQPEINNSLAGDTVLVKAGTYPESPNIDRSLTLKSESGRDFTTIVLQSGPTYLGGLTATGAGNDITIDGFTIQGFDAVGLGLASSNVVVTHDLGNVNVLNNRIRVGNIGAGSNGDDGIGLITYYSEVVDTDNLNVDNNIFEPLNLQATRAFFINPGVDGFSFTNNTIQGTFNRTGISQAKNGLVEANTVTGTGLAGSRSAGLGVWGYPDAAIWGHTTFRANTITGTRRAISLNSAGSVLIELNIISNNDEGIWAGDVLVPSLPATVAAHRNSITNSHTLGINNTVGGLLNATCNWYGNLSGPGGAGPGSGDDVSANVDFLPWLTAGSPLETAPCEGGKGDALVHMSGRIDVKGKPTLTLAGDISVVDGTILGSLSVNYKAINSTCVFTADANSSHTFVAGVLTLTNLANSCAAGEFTVVLKDRNFSPPRGAFSVDGLGSTYDIPLGNLTQGNIIITN